MAKRIKSKQPNLIPIKDWQEADRLVRIIGESRASIEKSEAEAKNKIDVIKARLAGDVEGTQKLIETTCRSIEAFALAHKDDFGAAKSRELNFGIIGWRKSTFITNGKKTLELVKNIYGKACAYIRVKESLDKEALARLTDEKLAEIGARREITDDFFVEPSIVKAAEYRD
jgi:phage host-nuclease inhibitor protein Gam